MCAGDNCGDQGGAYAVKVAIVHDWLVNYAGGERVLEQILRIYPHADLFSMVNFLGENQQEFIQNKPVQTSFIQNMPFAKSRYRQYLPLMPLAVEQFDLSGYDLIISSSHAVAKGVLTGPDQLHISYVHSPIRYAWDLHHQYLRETGLNKGLKGWVAKGILHYMRMWDLRTANGVDEFIANSNFIARRIMKVYRRQAEVIYPPVDVDGFSLCREKENFYLTLSRMVPYKKIDLIVEAFSQMPDKRLIVIGDGPDFAKIKGKAGKNVELLGFQPSEVVTDYMQKAKAFVFAAEEDFGITPVEAQACGTPVIAYGKGGALETICGLDRDKPTGVFFYEQTIPAVRAAIDSFENNMHKINYESCRENALRFSVDRFKDEIEKYINGKIAHFR